jgi:hypothetical protein
MGQDPSNPDCLSAAGVASQLAAVVTGAAAKPSTPSSLLSSPIAIGVGLLFAFLVIGGKR